MYLIDFDRCQLRKAAGSGATRTSCACGGRSRRSTYGLPRDRFGEADWHGLLDGYRQFSGEQPLTQ